MGKLSQIYEGWKNNLFPEEKMKELIQEVADERMAICNNCDMHSRNRVGYHSLRPDDHCTNCGCTLSAKTKCLSCECPLSKWKAVLTPDQEKEIDGDDEQA